jgi:hypothetical protein
MTCQPFDDGPDEGVALRPRRMQRQRQNSFRILGCDPRAHSRSQRETGDVRLFDLRSLHESHHIVRENLGGIRAFRFVGVTRTAQVD